MMFHWELTFVQVLERYGYDVTYASNLDFLRHLDLLEGIGAFVAAGHDEYWPAEERAQVDRALASGGTSLAYFGANGGYWRVRFLSGASGALLRTMVCFKGEAGDPMPGSTVRYRDEPNAQPENALFGTMYDGWQLIPFPLTVSNPAHWIYAGTNLRAGDLLHGLVGNEFDRIFENGYSPGGLEVSAEGPVVTAEGVPSKAQVVSRTLPSGRLVFSAGTFYWSLALSDDPELRDGRVERMTVNVLERALDHRRPPRAFPPVTGPSPNSPAPSGVWAAKVEPVAGVAGVSGYQDGPGVSAQFDGPTGLAVTALEQVVVAEAGGNRIRLIENDLARTVRTIAGNGLLGLRDGPGAQAMFRRPTGVAIGPDGAAYVADSDNHLIRRVELSPPYTVSTYAGSTRVQGYVDGPAGQARFRRPTALAFDGVGNLFVADQANHLIRKIDGITREVTTVAGSGGIGFADAPVGTQATFNNPSAIAVGASGALYVYGGGYALLRRIAPAAPHAVSTVAGAGPARFGFADGPGTQARFRAQMGLAASPAGDLFLADTANYRIRKILPGADAASTQVLTIAGTGRQGTALGSGDVADLVAPAGVAVGPSGRIYVSDSYNQVIRVITR